MPRCKLERLVDNPTPPRKYPPKQGPAIEADLSAAIVPSIPVTNTPLKAANLAEQVKTLKKLAGTPFVVDVETGIVYLEEKILKALKNN